MRFFSIRTAQDNRMATRTLDFERNTGMPDFGVPKGANLCGQCLVDERTTPASHAVTDAIQTADGWRESDKRFGCNQHRVTSYVVLLDGTRIRFRDYHVN